VDRRRPRRRRVDHPGRELRRRDVDLELFAGPNCQGIALADFNGQTGTFDQTASPGLALPKATDLSVELTNGSGTFSAKFFIDGYQIPGGAVPARVNLRQTTLRRSAS
jgi:hypothetical protein